MKAKYILSIVAVVLGSAGCTNYFDEHMLGNSDP